MSASDSADSGRLTPRVIRVRNRCLAVLAARRSLPLPSAHDLDALGGASLADAWRQWENSHTPLGPPTRGFELPTAPRARWRSPLVLRTAGVALAGVLGFLVGDVYLPRATAQTSAGSIEQPWLAVTDSVESGLTEALYRPRNARAAIALSPADVAALIFRTPRRRAVLVDSLSARADTLLGIRGRLGDARFELRGEVRLLRRGLAELHVVVLRVDGVDVDPSLITRLVARGRPRDEESDRLRFVVPSYVTGVDLLGGNVLFERDQAGRRASVAR